MSFLGYRTDAYDQPIHEGDVCAHYTRTTGIQYVVYKGTAWGGPKSRGHYGRFITQLGPRTIRYKSVVLAPVTAPVKRLLKEYYEGV